MPDIEQTLRAAAADLPLPSQSATDRALGAALSHVAPEPRAQRRLRRTPGRMLVIAAAVLILGGGIAAAFGERIADLVGGNPVPSSIHRAFERALFPARQGRKQGEPYAGRPIRSSEQLVLDHPSRLGGDLRIYTTRSTLGARCYLIARTQALTVTCGLPGVIPKGRAIELLVAYQAPTGVRTPAGIVIAGRPYDARATAVRVRFRSGPSTQLTLDKRWFVFEPTTAQTIANGPSAVQSIDVLDAAGHTIGSEPNPLSRFTMLMPQPILPTSSTIRLLERTTLPNGGGTIAIWSGRAADGDGCFRYLRNGRSQRRPAWNCGPDVGRYGQDAHATIGKPPGPLPHIPLEWQTYGRGLSDSPEQYAYAVGWAAPGITRLRLRFQDGSHTTIPLHGRYYLYLVPAAHWKYGARPLTLTGLDTRGRRIATTNLYPNDPCRYPGDSCSFGTG